MRTGFRTMQWRRNDGFRAPQGPIDNSPAPLAPGDVGRSRRVPEGRLKFSRTNFTAAINVAKHSNPSREAAPERSPRRKPWVKKRAGVTSPERAKEKHARKLRRDGTTLHASSTPASSRSPAPSPAGRGISRATSLKLGRYGRPPFFLVFPIAAFGNLEKCYHAAFKVLSRFRASICSGCFME
jgi:hypothetical protein